MGVDSTITENDEIIEYVMELLGKRYKKTQIRIALREIHPNVTLPTMEAVITLAKKRIREKLKIDPQEYRGYLIEELERLLRNNKTPIRYRLKTIHEIASLLGLHHIPQTEDPLEYAAKVQAALAAMDNTVKGLPDEQNSEGEGTQQKDSQGTEETP